MTNKLCIKKKIAMIPSEGLRLDLPRAVDI